MKRVLVIALVLAACGGEDPTGVIVSAASSLTDAFGELEAAYEAENPDIDLILNLGGSAALRDQILEGAPSDVFAPASLDMVRQVTSDDVRSFAHSQLYIAVPLGNPGGVTGLSDFGRSELLVGLCVEPAPCGALARQALDMAGVAVSLDTSEPNARALLAKIEAGELDLGIVYVTDVLKNQVEGIALDHFADYAIALVPEAVNPEAGQGFINFVLSEQGQTILAEYGFLTE